jgi:cystathionine gamma-synthase
VSVAHDPLDPSTWVVTAGRPGRAGEPLNYPISPVSTFAHGAERIYSRGDSTPAWEALETVLGGLEEADAVSFASGMAAAAAVFAPLPTGSRVLLPDDCYHGVVKLAENGSQQARWTVERLPMTDTDGWCSRMGSVDLAWIESPTNPLLETADLTTILRAGSGTSTLVAVDNTFATALRQRPLDLGADLCMQSSTKFIGGHSDLLGGVVTTRRPDLLKQLRETRSLQGATPGALETFLALRGVRTMALRLDRAESTARFLVKQLSEHPAVINVRYPGFGSMVSFETLDGERADRLCQALGVIIHATSLGGVESTLERRAATPGQEHLPAGLIRFSVGCEAPEDLWADLQQALQT